MSELVFGAPLAPEEHAAFLARHAFSPEDRAALGGELERLLVYRTLVRGTLRDAVTLAIPRTIARLGALFDECFDRFLRERGPQSHYLRDVTSELLDFCAPLWAADPRVPPWAHELARHEALQIVVSSSREALKQRELGELDLERGLAFSAAARVARYGFAVHRLSAEETDKSEPERVATALFVYRDREHDVRYLELSPVAAALLEQLLAGSSLKDALLTACAQTGTEPGAALEGAAHLLSELAERGALLGALSAEAPGDPAPGNLAGSARKLDDAPSRPRQGTP